MQISIGQSKPCWNTNNIDNFDEVLTHDNHDSNKPVIPVSCESNEPIIG